MKDIEKYSDQAIEMIMTYGPKLILAIIVLIVGLLIIRPVVKGLKNTMNKRNVDPSLVPFISSIVNIVLKLVLFISVASMVGIETTSLIAVLGAASLAVGLALQGSLANFAGGVLILVLRPFKVGDVVETQGFLGIVKQIQIFNTIVNTFDNKRIIIPNGPLSNGNIINYSTEEDRRVDWTFGVSYSDDIDKVKKILIDEIFSDERIIKEPAEPFIALTALADSSVNFQVRVWVKAADYWPLYFEKLESVKKRFDKEGVSIPFPQRDVHLYQEK